MFEKIKLRLPASRRLTAWLLALTLVWLAVGLAANLMWTPTIGWLKLALSGFDALSIGWVFWLVDQQERHNPLVNNWWLALSFILLLILLLTAPIKPVFLVL